MTDAETVSRYLVLPAERGEPYERRRWWRREGVYVSDVCLAIHISVVRPECASDEEPQAQQALYGYVRRIGHTAMDHDVMRPVACVVEAPAELELRLSRWSSDQDWHRGSFTLYVEVAGRPLDHWSRLADLLSPSTEPVSLEAPTPRPISKIAADLETALNQREWTSRARLDAKGLIDSIRDVLMLKDQDLYEKPEHMPKDPGERLVKLAEARLEKGKGWAPQVIGKADDIAHGERVP